MFKFFEACRHEPSYIDQHPYDAVDCLERFIPCTLRTLSHALCSYSQQPSCGGFGPNGFPPAYSEVSAQPSRDTPLLQMAEVVRKIACAVGSNLLSAELEPVPGIGGNCGQNISETHGTSAEAGVDDAASASASASADKEAGVQVLSNLLARGESELDEEIASLKKHRADMKQEKNILNATLRNTEKTKAPASVNERSSCRRRICSRSTPCG